MATSPRSSAANTDQSTFLLEEPHANRSASQDCGAAWETTVATWPSNILGWLTVSGPAGWFGRMSPVSCHRTEEGILVPSSGAWSNSGMASPIECLTLNTSEHCHSLGPSRNGGDVCSLSDVLETGDVPQRYFLTEKACRGILRRAGNRGKSLPPQLARALQAVAGSGPTST